MFPVPDPIKPIHRASAFHDILEDTVQNISQYIAGRSHASKHQDAADSDSSRLRVVEWIYYAVCDGYLQSEVK